MKNRSLISRILSHDIVLMILSFLIAFGAWFVISANSETDTNVTISDIPVTIDLPDEAIDDGLMIFTKNEITASVEVSGNRITVGSLTPSDISVYATQTNSIIAPNTYTLVLSAKKQGTKSNYDIVSSVTPLTVTVLVDKLKETQFDIENQLVYQVDDGYYASATLSQSNVTVSGPESQINEIASVAVTGTFDSSLNDTRTATCDLVYLDADGKKLDLPLCESDISSVDVSVSVYPVADIDLKLDTSGAPSSYPEIEISPSTLKIAGPRETIDDLLKNGLTVGTIDFSKISNEKITRSFDISLPSGCKNLSNDTAVKAEIDLSAYAKKTVTCKISGNIDSSKYKTEYANTSVDITIIGPQELIDTISVSNISVIADFTNLFSEISSDSTVSLQVPLNITFTSGYDACWVYDTYTANVNVSMK